MKGRQGDPSGSHHRRHTSLVSLLAFAALLVAGSRAIAQAKPQQPYVPQYKLTAGEATPVGGLNWIPALSPVKCDANANLYMRLLRSGFGRHVFSTPVTKFSPDGEQEAVYSLNKAQGWDPGDVFDFAIGQDGTVYLLADHPTKHRKIVDGILAFDKDGNYLSTISLDLPVHTVERLAVFSNGDFLVTGDDKVKPPAPRIPGTPITPKQPKNDQPSLEPIAFVVNSRGELVNKVLLPEDPLSIKNGKATGAPLQFNGSDEGFQSLVAANDGNIYAMFPTNPPIIYAISHTGDILRSFFVDMPSPHYTAMEMSWAGGFDGLLLGSDEIKNHGLTAAQMLFSVVDPSNGQRIADYQGVAQLGTLPACFTQQHIYFLGSDKGRLVIREAVSH